MFRTAERRRLHSVELNAGHLDRGGWHAYEWLLILLIRARAAARLPSLRRCGVASQAEWMRLWWALHSATRSPYCSPPRRA